MKALLHARGYSLYGDVWNDQPPLMTVTLSALFSWVGVNVAAARVVVMLLAALLLWCVYLLARRTSGTVAAVAAVILLVLSEFYLRLSGALMIGLPALALATLSLTVLVLWRPTWWRIVLSAAVMALALNTKLMVGLVGPACVVALLLAGQQAGERRWLRTGLLQALVWSLAVGGMTVLLAVALGATNMEMLVGAHVSNLTREQEKFLAEAAAFFPHFVEQQAAYLLVAAVGVVWAFVRRRWGVRGAAGLVPDDGGGAGGAPAALVPLRDPAERALGVALCVWRGGVAGRSAGASPGAWGRRGPGWRGFCTWAGPRSSWRCSGATRRRCRSARRSR